MRQCIESASLNIWKIHAVAVVHNHMHVILSWDSQVHISMIKARLKQQLTHALNSSTSQYKQKWFGRGSGVCKIRDMDHLIELVKKYLPQHGDYVWIEERVLTKLR